MPEKDRRMNATVPIEYGRDGDKTFWHNVGTAFENDKGQITIYLNSLPLPGRDGKVKLMLFDKKDDERGGDRGGGARSTGNASRKRGSGAPSRGDDADDEIPF